MQGKIMRIKGSLENKAEKEEREREMNKEI